MKLKNLSIKKIYLIISAGIFITSGIFILYTYMITKDRRLILLGILFTLCIYLWFGIFIALVRKKLVLFTLNISSILDKIINNKDIVSFNLEKETLISKINHKFQRLSEILKENNDRVFKEKANLEKLISDISHQVKTPMANLKMINSTLIESNLSREKEIEFLKSMEGQLDKLEFLMDSMIKTSRLETGIITLNKKKFSIYDTIAEVMGAIIFKAEKKDIQIIVDCDPNLFVFQDKKWTTEALFNIVDNAVKYTPSKGKININCFKMEMYTRIDIKDTGIGIKEKHQGEIFKRFYREKKFMIYLESVLDYILLEKLYQWKMVILR
ncbi:HAMP domain-containing sensor histidine kinase [Clostridium oceanicum]|uniref:histidine kinase n=1 Tax=Clostridium oceanicum TaxID=1543 RepID=A0ABN1JXF9_9CLOT